MWEKGECYKTFLEKIKISPSTETARMDHLKYFVA